MLDNTCVVTQIKREESNAEGGDFWQPFIYPCEHVYPE